MKKEIEVNINLGFPYFIFAVCSAMIVYTIHNSVFWSIVDFFFAPIVWIKWIICHEVTLNIIKETFNWFFAV